MELYGPAHYSYPQSSRFKPQLQNQQQQNAKTKTTANKIKQNLKKKSVGQKKSMP